MFRLLLLPVASFTLKRGRLSLPEVPLQDAVFGLMVSWCLVG